MKRVSEMTDDEVRDLAGSRVVPEYSVKDTAERAAEAVRLLNYLTLPGDGAPGLRYPADLYDIAASLKAAPARMPQLFAQLARWLQEELAAGRIAHDGGLDPAEPVREVCGDLADADEAASALAAALDRVHNGMARLRANT